jgi:hypothetical protein
VLITFGCFFAQVNQSVNFNFRSLYVAHYQDIERRVTFPLSLQNKLLPQHTAGFLFKYSFDLQPLFLLPRDEEMLRDF